MITSIRFRNFKVLREATLPLGPFTLIVGPNGSGKSTAMQAFSFVQNTRQYEYDQVVTAGLPEPSDVEIQLTDDGPDAGLYRSRTRVVLHHPDWQDADPQPPEHWDDGNFDEEHLGDLSPLQTALATFKVYSFDAKSIARPVEINTKPELSQDGFGLANVLDHLSDQEPERWRDLNKELNRWLPEFDHITFERPSNSSKIFQLRTTLGHHKYRADDLSQGTLFAVALLTLAYLKEPPAIVCFEEPDHGIHPRLLTDLRDAMYRLAYPKSFGENREPVQVIATTHSPYLLDLYKDHPEEVVIAHKDEQGAHFQRLSEKPHLGEILEGVALGEVWFSGILGGVPANP
jgi:predicted ATPase